ncbi:MAG TPA: hypothetical protein PKZ97_12105 [Azospirillaceae bacterium]|nr:hypothetical protein [Azospirillaceae bacterium]HRQ81851.1 hypothetical protein [Azospirillaceae bacterium]
MTRNSVFEVQSYQAGRWILDARFEDEAEARSHGKRLLAGGKVDGYRVVKDWRRADGRHVETEVHSEFRAVSNAITIQPIDEAPPICVKPDDMFAVESRMVMNRILRSYIDRMVVTPTEIMHNYSELKRLLDRDNIAAQAVGRVAALQAEKVKSDGRARRDEIFDMINGVTERARKASARKDLPDVTAHGFRPLFEKLDAAESAEDRDFLARVVLSRDLVQMRNWMAKLDFLSEVVRSDGGLTEAPLVLVDGVIADVFGAPSVAQELLGEQRSLCDALCALIDLSRGRLTFYDRSEEDRAVQLNELLAFHDLDQTRYVMLEMVRRQVKSTQPLYRADPAAEMEAFNRLLLRVTTPEGIVGGPLMAEALVMRYMRFLEAGGALGRRQAMEQVVGCYKDAKDKVRFLIEFSGSDIGEQHFKDVSALLLKLTADSSAIGGFVDRNLPIRDNLEQITLLYAQVAECMLPDPLRGQLAGNLDNLLADYIIASKVVERLDNPDDTLRHRANKLMMLCAPGMLQSPKALDIVRRRVVAHLRQPNFDKLYVADIPEPSAQQRALREFYKLLGQAGFM